MLHHSWEKNIWNGYQDSNDSISFTANDNDNNTSPRNQIEEGIEAVDWLETNDWFDKEILQEAKNRKLDKITDLESETGEKNLLE